MKEKLTVRLPKDNLDFVKAYAAAHQITVTEMINRYLEQLRTQHSDIDPAVAKISGLVPEDIDVNSTYHEAMLSKHQ